MRNATAAIRSSGEVAFHRRTGRIRITGGLGAMRSAIREVVQAGTK